MTTTTQTQPHVPTTKLGWRLLRLGRALHPESVTDAWYAAHCPPSFHPRRHGVSRVDWLRWRVSYRLRLAGCAR